MSVVCDLFTQGVKVCNLVVGSVESVNFGNVERISVGVAVRSVPFDFDRIRFDFNRGFRRGAVCERVVRVNYFNSYSVSCRIQIGNRG